MKTFINAARIAIVMVLFVSLSALGVCNTCPKSCAPKTTKCNTGCKLQPEPVTIRKTCDHPGYYKQVCHLEYEPCNGKVEEHKMMPIYKGCFDEQGNAIEGSRNFSNESSNSAYTNDVQVEVIAPTYDRVYGGNGSRVQRNNRAIRNNNMLNNTAAVVTQ